MAVKAGLDFDSSTVTKRLQIMRKRGLKQFGAAMYEEMKEVELPEVQASTPVRTGLLLSTVRVTGPDYRGTTQVRVGITAGGMYGVNYAIPVHETHPTHSKFIERPLREAAPFILQRVARRVRWNQMIAAGE